ncbi:NAD(P)H-binding protein [Streptomyces dysideae]|uniref:NAD(P)-dependent oxidoreductase n=1 Tax=Streptomyces dysideae TaxID=909626 RepID=A0A101UY94_9ACTN|nr:NAD(P)H-binding protein [Streptomyces dysideae]KUO19110.1 NAD(P)-dependent oxidoreductase [Streptomyces dysideae]
MILLTGATGTVGRLVARRLREAAVPVPVRLLTRDPRRAADLTGPQLEVVGGDFGDPASLRRALAGVRSALLVTSDPLTPAHDEHFVAAARAAGVRHVVKLSALAVTDPDATDLLTAWQRRNEQLLCASGLLWTLLRPRAFMSNTLGWARSVREEGVVRARDGTSVSATVDPRDVADVAVRALLDADGHAGRAYPLTGPEAVSAVRQTEVLGELLQRPLGFEELSETEARLRLLARYPAALADALVESAARGRAGAKGRVDPTAAELLGRPAGGYREWARDHLAAFRA